MLPLSPLPRTLTAALRDARNKKLEVRVSALRDLGRLAGDPDGEAAGGEQRAQALAGLVEVLEHDGAEGVRADACLALADARAREHVPALIEAVARDPSVRVRQLALVAVGELADADDDAARAVIEGALDDEHAELRFQALIALVHLAPAAAEPALLGAMGDDDAQIRRVAFRLAEESWVRDAGGSDVPKRLLARARAALDDDAPQVRLAAAILLGRTGERGGRAALLRAIENGTGADEPEDAEAAIELAAELELAEARDGLARRAFGVFGLGRDPFAWQARVALARLGDERAERAILKGLESWSRDARTLAVAAAGRARLSAARPILLQMQGDDRRADPEAVREALARLAVPARTEA